MQLPDVPTRTNEGDLERSYRNLICDAFAGEESELPVVVVTKSELDRERRRGNGHEKERKAPRVRPTPVSAAADLMKRMTERAVTACPSTVLSMTFTDADAIVVVDAADRGGLAFVGSLDVLFTRGERKSFEVPSLVIPARIQAVVGRRDASVEALTSEVWSLGIGLAVLLVAIFLGPSLAPTIARVGSSRPPPEATDRVDSYPAEAQGPKSAESKAPWVPVTPTPDSLVLAKTLIREGAWDMAFEMLERLGDAAKAVGDDEAAGYACGNQAWIYELRHDWSAARKRHDAALRHFQAAGHSDGKVQAYVAIAALLNNKDSPVRDRQAALAYLAQASDLAKYAARTTQGRLALTHAQVLLSADELRDAEVAFARGQAKQAEGCFDLDEPEKREALTVQMDCAKVLGDRKSVSDLRSELARLPASGPRAERR